MRYSSCRQSPLLRPKTEQSQGIWLMLHMKCTLFSVAAQGRAEGLVYYSCSTVMWSVVLHDPAWRTRAVIRRLL